MQCPGLSSPSEPGAAPAPNFLPLSRLLQDPPSKSVTPQQERNKLGSTTQSQRCGEHLLFNTMKPDKPCLLSSPGITVTAPAWGMLTPPPHIPPLLHICKAKRAPWKFLRDK